MSPIATSPRRTATSRRSTCSVSEPSKKSIHTVVSTMTGMASRPHFFEIAFPTNLSAQCKHLFLLLDSDQRLQRFIDNRLFGRQGGEFLRFIEQIIIQHN